MDKKRNKVRIVLLVLLAVLTAFWLFFSFAPSKYKSAVIKEISTWPVVRKIVAMSVQDDYEKKVMDEGFDADQVEVNQRIAEKLTGYTNIALFGLDSRDAEMDEGTHSDSIMVVSINNDTNAVRIVSVYRDTMLKVVNPEGKIAYTKANQGFFRGGAEGALSMLNTNLDLDITDYVTINFSGLAEIIDGIGGLDVNINEQEMKYINFYLIRTREITGMESEDVQEYGDVHLNGLQATAFCRIRYTPFYDEEGNKYSDDLGRTARQRYIISKIVEKVKESGVSGALSLAQSVMDKNAQGTPFIKSSLSYNDIMDLIPVMIDYNIEDTTGFPFTLDTPTINEESLVVAQGLSYNVQKLHEFLFDEEDYQVSQEVQDISDYIMNYTGIGEVRLKEDRPEEETSAEESADGQ